MRATSIPGRVLLSRRRWREMGVSSGRLSGSEFIELLPGLLTPRADPVMFEDMARALQTQVIPGAVLSHTTAAVLYGVPVPAWVDDGIGLLRRHTDSRRGIPHLSLFAPVDSADADAAASAGSTAHATDVLRIPHLHCRIPQGSSRLSAGPTVTVHRMLPGATRSWRGLMISSPAEMLLELALTLDHDDVVIVLDHLLGPNSIFAGLTRTALRRRFDDLAGRRGHRALRTALEDARSAVESPGETRTRLLLVRAGFPEPTPNLTVRDPDTGGSRRIDNAYERWLIGVEYDGDVHRSKGAWRAEHARRDSLESLGWTLRRLTARDIRRPARFLTALRRSVLAAGGEAPPQSNWSGSSERTLGRPQRRPRPRRRT